MFSTTRDGRGNRSQSRIHRYAPSRLRRERVRVLGVLSAVGLVCLNVGVAAPPAQALGITYVVLSAGDQPDANPGDGICLTAGATCTLRAAMTEADSDNGTSAISFAIPGAGVQTIALTSPLPNLDDQAGGTTINGYTQPGSAVNTDPVVDNAVLRIEISGGGSSSFDAIDISSPGNVVRGIAFYDLRLAVAMAFGGNDNVIVGNFIGTNAAATFKDTVTNSNSFGVVIDQLAARNHIGQPGAADRNVISGNAGRAVMLKDAVVDNVIQNNIIGLAPNGLSRLPNADHGVDVNSGATRTLVGGSGPQEGNLISGNDGHGVEVSHAPTSPTVDNQIIGNRIGTGPSGTAGPAFARNGDRYGHENVHTEDHVTGTVIADNIIGNSLLGGIKVDNGSSGTHIRGNRIGISANGAAISNGLYGVQIELGSHDTVVAHNVIANNRTGIRLQGDTTVANSMSENSIFANSRLGIDIAPFDDVNGPSVTTATNGGIRAPAITKATSTAVTGQACPGCRVEVFESDSTTTDVTLESSYGEGRTFLAAGNAAAGGGFTVAVPSSSTRRVVTTTATDAAGNTSEFSGNAIAPGAVSAPK